MLCIKFFDPRILSLLNWERARRVSCTLKMSLCEVQNLQSGNPPLTLSGKEKKTGNWKKEEKKKEYESKICFDVRHLDSWWQSQEMSENENFDMKCPTDNFTASRGDSLPGQQFYGFFMQIFFQLFPTSLWSQSSENNCSTMRNYRLRFASRPSVS